MAIRKLPAHIINKLKAGEIVERPASVLKELIENSIDAGAKNINVEVFEGGKKSIKVEDDGVGISSQELPLVIDRYTTSKIEKEDDLNNIFSYGFRGEALSSIGEVSKFTLQTKKEDEVVANEFKKIGEDVFTNQIPFHKERGSIVFVEELFYNVPARQKFLKTSSTERTHLRSVFLDFVLVNYDKGFYLKKDGKTVFNLKPASDVLERIYEVFKKDWEKNLKVMEKKDEERHIYGAVSDAGLTFSSLENIKIFVNKRPVHDKLLRKAVMDAYYRQIPSGEYPLAVLFFDIQPSLVDVNVHPRKLEVKFLDPGTNFNFVKSCIEEVFSQEKISGGNLEHVSGVEEKDSRFDFGGSQKQTAFKEDGNLRSKPFDFSGDKNELISSQSSKEDFYVQNKGVQYRILGQIWDCYILLESDSSLFVVDQHAIAERINFENMKERAQKEGRKPEILLNPLSFQIPKNVDVENKLEEFNELGFDVSLLSEDKVVIYAVPQIFTVYKVDIEKLFDKLLQMEEVSMDNILEKIFETQACKNSIKSGQRLSFEEMQRLIEDGFEFITGGFSCQHGRPSFVELGKEDIDKLFDRK